MTTTADQARAKIAKMFVNADRLDQIINGDSGAMVPTDGGNVPTIAKLLSEFSVVNGWTPLMSVTSDGARRVVEIYDWQGGPGVKPQAPLYLANGGLSPNIADANDIRGPAGDTASAGVVDSLGDGSATDVAPSVHATATALATKADAAAMSTALAGKLGDSANDEQYYVRHGASWVAFNTPRLFSAIATTHIPTFVNSFRVDGYASVNPRAAATYKRVGSQPTHAAKAQSSDGAWWELAEQEISPEMFGSPANNTTGDGAIMNKMVAYCAATGCPAWRLHGAPQSIYNISDIQVDIANIPLNIRTTGIMVETNEAGVPPPLTYGTWIVNSRTTGYGIRISGNYSRGISVGPLACYEPQSAVTGGWVPIARQPFWRVENSGGLAHFSYLFGCAVYHLLDATGLGRLRVDKIAGQVWNIGLQIDGSADYDYVGDVHFWPFWNASNTVVGWQQNNTSAVVLARADGVSFGTLFCLAAKNGLRLIAGASGHATKFTINKLYTDFTKNGISVEANDVNGYIAHLEHHGGDFTTGTSTPQTGATGLNITGTGCKLTFGKFRSDLSHKTIAKLTGANSEVVASHVHTESSGDATTDMVTFGSSDCRFYCLNRPTLFVANFSGFGTTSLYREAVTSNKTTYTTIGAPGASSTSAATYAHGAGVTNARGRIQSIAASYLGSDGRSHPITVNSWDDTNVYLAAAGEAGRSIRLVMMSTPDEDFF